MTQVSQIFLRQGTKVKTRRENTLINSTSENEIHLIFKETIKKINRQGEIGRRNVQYSLDKEIVQNYVMTLKMNNQKANNTIKSLEKNLNMYFTKEDIRV